MVPAAIGSDEDSVEILFGLLRHIRGGRTPDSGALLIYGPTIGAYMDREHVRGAADKAKGAIKEAAGKVAGDEGADRREAR